jgi:hypothetical protein
MLQPVLTVPVTVRFIAVPGKAMLMPVMLVVNRPAGNFTADASHWTNETFVAAGAPRAAWLGIRLLRM